MNQMSQSTKRLETVLLKIISDHHTHARWINLLSYLEFMGSRKIFKTQKNGRISEAILKHAADEARHALILKQMISKITDDSGFEFYNASHILNAYSGFRYMQSLDAMVKKYMLSVFGSGEDFSYICYVYMSYVIEVRANWLYDIYSGLLERNKSAIHVSGIISDEVRHLDDMSREITNIDSKSGEHIKYFLGRESMLFERFLTSVEHCLMPAEKTA